jgi:hypothetical protein
MMTTGTGPFGGYGIARPLKERELGTAPSTVSKLSPTECRFSACTLNSAYLSSW